MGCKKAEQTVFAIEGSAQRAKSHINAPKPTTGLLDRQPPAEIKNVVVPTSVVSEKPGIEAPTVIEPDLEEAKGSKFALKEAQKFDDTIERRHTTEFQKMNQDVA